MLPPRLIARLIPEDVADTYQHLKRRRTLKESGVLWHRQQQGGHSFEAETPIGMVMDFLRDHGKISRYDLQSFLDMLKDCIENESAEMVKQAQEMMVDSYFDAGADPHDPADSSATHSWIDEKLLNVSDRLNSVVPVIRRSLAQARSRTHAEELLQRHIDRLSDSVRDVVEEAPEGADQMLDLVHGVAGGIMQTAEVIKDEIFPMLWGS